MWNEITERPSELLYDKLMKSLTRLQSCGLAVKKINKLDYRFLDIFSTGSLAVKWRIRFGFWNFVYMSTSPNLFYQSRDFISYLNMSH